MTTLENAKMKSLKDKYSDSTPTDVKVEISEKKTISKKIIKSNKSTKKNDK